MAHLLIYLYLIDQSNGSITTSSCYCISAAMTSDLLLTDLWCLASALATLTPLARSLFFCMSLLFFSSTDSSARVAIAASSQWAMLSLWLFCSADEREALEILQAWPCVLIQCIIASDSEGFRVTASLATALAYRS